MPINQNGEYVREVGAPERPKDPIVDLCNKRDALLTHSIVPVGVEQNPDLLYWAPDRLTHNRLILEQMKTLAAANNLNEIRSPYTGETISLTGFFHRVESSLAYSENINKKRSKS